MKPGIAISLLFLLLPCSILWGSQAQAPARPSGPNIIVIVADDLGYADIGVQGGSRDVKTPRVDSLAANGVRFSSGYVSCPVCSPTRAGLLTGRYQQRFGHELNPPPPPATGCGLPLDQITLAAALKQAGYATGMVGKWHLGMMPGYRPWERGFDEYWGFLHGMHDYLDLSEHGGRGVDAVVTARSSATAQPAEPTKVHENGYLTDLLGREATSFIQRHKNEPFFLYLPFNAVHSPLEAPQRYLDEFPGIADQKRRTMLAMLKAMDDAVGSVLDEVRKNGLEEKTLIFFFSDNGGPTAGNGSRNEPFSGFKSDVLEGGIRIPFMIQWKGHLPAGKVLDQPVIQLDIFATAINAAGGRMPADRIMDGVDLIPYIRGEKTGPPHEYLFWRYGPQSAVRKGNWKLFIAPKHGTKLVNLSTDVTESKDLSKEQPQVLTDLQAALAKWQKELTAPLWGRGTAGSRAAKTK